MKPIKYLLYLILLSFMLCAAAQADGLEVHFLDIGRNDGILIRCGGEDVFIDSGGYSEGRTAVAYMKKAGVEQLKYYIGTHAHEDHVGGAPLIIEAFLPQAVLQPHRKVKDVIIRNIRDADQVDVVRNADYVNITRGQSVQVGGAVLTCLGPLNVRYAEPEWGSENNNSLVLMLSYGEVNILLTADATAEELLEIEAASPGAMRADVLKNPHHNQYLDEKVFSLIAPQYTVFSTAKDRLPEAVYSQLLNRYGSAAFITASNHSGNVVLRTDGQAISFETTRRVESISLDQTSLEVYQGKTARVKASVEPAGRTKMLLYESSNPSVASVDYNGKITALSPGTAVIRVSDAGGAYAECTVSVCLPQVKFKKTELSVKHGSKLDVNWWVEPSGAKDRPVWTSLNEAVAQVDQKGRITGVYPGQTEITAVMPGGQVGRVSVTVLPVEVKSISVGSSSVSVTIGESKKLSAKISPSNATWKNVTWSSADGSIASVSQDGTLYAAGVGKTKITAEAVGGKKCTVSVTVKPIYVKKITFPQSSIELICGLEGYDGAQAAYAVEPSDATIPQMSWSSSDKRIVSVDQNGMIKAVNRGSAYITCKATDGSGKYARIKVNVELPTQTVVLNKTALEVYEGTGAALKASVIPASSTKRLFYESSDPDVAVVSDSGKVIGVREGSAVIRVRDAAGTYAECSVTVRRSEMTLKKTELTVKHGSVVGAQWSMKPSAAEPRIAWISEDGRIASVDGSGRITGVYPGETVITAVMPGGQTHRIALTVEPVHVSRVSVSPSDFSLTIGGSRTLKASVSPSGATWKDVTWSSADESIAVVSSDGTVRAVGVGSTKIRAEAVGGKSCAVSVRVKPIYVKSISLSKPNAELIGGVEGRNRVQLSCRIEPSDATVRDVTWSSSNQKIAVVSSDGVVTGLKEGSVTITCKAADGSGCYACIKVTFKANELSKGIAKIDGEMTLQATAMRYRENGTILEVVMTYHNRTGTPQPAPYRGMLVLIAPDGTEIPLTNVHRRPSGLPHKCTADYTYRIAVSSHPRLRGLDLSRCDVVMKDIIE